MLYFTVPLYLINYAFDIGNASLLTIYYIDFIYVVTLYFNVLYHT